jgi:hypothetical protein
MNPREKDNGDERRPPPPVLTWEDVELGRTGQLNLPGLIPLPTVAERAFLVLARQWHAEFSSLRARSTIIPPLVRQLALASVLLALEWGRKFTPVAWQQVRANTTIATARSCDMNRLAWELCEVVNFSNPSKTFPIKSLTQNLINGGSTIRIWCIQLAWLSRTFVAKHTAVPLLLQNVEDKLLGVPESMALARELCESDEELNQFVAAYRPVTTAFVDQFENRIKYFREEGFRRFQGALWALEAECRSMIEGCVMSAEAPIRLRVSEPKTDAVEQSLEDGDFDDMTLDPDRPFLEQFEERAMWDDKCRKWLETEVYTNLELMKDLDPVSVAWAKQLATRKQR